ncbi:hypothetical protein GMMP13_170028 [Candidatus Magnetomoraceae bacterium gMMP-13]
MRSLSTLIIHVITVILFYFTASFAGDLQSLYNHIRIGKTLEAKEKLLNDTIAFGEPQKASKIIADHLMKKSKYEDAAEMYDYCVKFSSYYDDIRKEIRLPYLKASLKHPNFLEKWCETYQYEINDKIRDIAKEALKKKFDHYKSDPINKKYPEEAYSRLAELIAFNEKPYKEIKNAVAKIDELKTRKQSKIQVVTVVKKIKKLKKKKINIPGDLEDRYIKLKKYYVEFNRGKSTNSFKTGCEAYKSALTYLNQANGQDTENVECSKKRSCLYVEGDKLVHIIVPKADDNSKRINTKIQQINDFQKKINQLKSECNLEYPSSADHIELLDVADDYYISLRKLKNNNNENTLIAFYNKYQKNKKYSDWHKLAGFHIGTHYYVTAKNFLTQKPQFNNEAVVLEKLKNTVTNFRKFREHLSAIQINPIQQYSLLKKVLDKIKSGLLKNIDTKGLNPGVKIAWDIERKINDVRTRQALARVSVENTSENSTISTLSTSTEATSSISLMKKRIRSTLSTTENTTSILTTQMTTTSISPMNKRKKSTNMDLLKKARNAFNERHYLEAWELYKKAYPSKRIEKLIVKISKKIDKQKRRDVLMKLELDNQDEYKLDILSLAITCIFSPEHYFSETKFTKPSSLFKTLTITQDDELSKHLFYGEDDEKKSDGLYLKGLSLEHKKHFIEAILRHMEALNYLFKALEDEKVKSQSIKRVKWKIGLLDNYILEKWQRLPELEQRSAINKLKGNISLLRLIQDNILHMIVVYQKVAELKNDSHAPKELIRNYFTEAKFKTFTDGFGNFTLLPFKQDITKQIKQEIINQIDLRKIKNSSQIKKYLY